MQAVLSMHDLHLLSDTTMSMLTAAVSAQQSMTHLEGHSKLVSRWELS